MRIRPTPCGSSFQQRLTSQNRSPSVPLLLWWADHTHHCQTFNLRCARSDTTEWLIISQTHLSKLGCTRHADMMVPRMWYRRRLRKVLVESRPQVVYNASHGKRDSQFLPVLRPQQQTCTIMCGKPCGIHESRSQHPKGGGLAQLGEHYVRNVGVGGSTPLPSTNLPKLSAA